MQAQENGVILDEEQSLFLAGGLDNAIDEDVDEQPVQDLALNVDNVFQADDCDAYDSDVDDAPTAQTLFMANLSSADPVYDEAGPSYDSDVLSEVQAHDHYQDAVCDHHEEHEMHDDVRPNHVVDSHADYTSDSNMTSYDQYVKDNAVPVVQNNASMVPNDAYVMIDNDLHDSDVRSVSHTPRNTVANNLLNAELATYKEQVELYERRARFELTEREQKIDEQLRIVICDRNIKEENLKRNFILLNLQLALPSNITTIGYKNPLCLHRARQVQPALYSGHVIVTPNHAPAVVRDCEETLEQSEISRKKMHDKMKAKACVDNKKQLTPEQLFWSQDIVKMKAEALKEQNTRPIKALTVYPPNTPATLVPRVLPTKSQVKINIFTLRQLFSEFDKTCKKRITPTGITEGERGFEQTKTCYLTEVIPFFKTLQEHFEGIQKALTKEVKEMSDAFDELEAELEQSTVDRKHDAIERKNLLLEHDNIIADCLLKEVFYVASNSELNVVRFTEMQKAHHVVKTRCLELEVELSNLRDDIRKDNYNDLLNRFSNLEVNHLNLQLKYQNLKDSFQNKPSSSVNDTPDFNSVFVIGQMKASLQGKDNVIQKLKMQISQFQETRSELDRPLDLRGRDFQISQLTEEVNSLQEQNELFRAENAKIKQHYKELYDSIKITRAKHTEQTTALKSENESLKVQIQNTVSYVTTTQFKPKVTAPGKYALDVEPIPPRNRNNREVHLVYLRHLKESVDTLREIVEEAKVERPLDRSLAFACRYTKHSQELLEYVFGTCPKVFNQQDKKHANTPRKKQVTFEDQSATSSSTTHKHVEPMHTQKSNVPVPPSTGVNSCTDASGSQPRSILKKHRIPPAKSDSLKKVEDHSRTIRSSLKTMNRVDSSISSKRTVINSNSHSVCQTCNKCLFLANHDMCVVTYLHSVNASPNVKNVVRHVKQVWKPKQVTQVGKPKHIKQIWKPTGKTLNNVGYQWRPTGRTFTLSDQCPLTRFTKLTGMSAIACANQSEPNQHWGSNFQTLHLCLFSNAVRFGNDHFGAIMGYGDYVVGDSVISRVYYVEGLGHNLFSVGQFCDLDLEVAFRKHSCYVRDTDGVELLKGSHGSNLYTIFVKDMMKSSLICLLSKASKNKSWLWHRRLNHLNFGTINDLARKDLCPLTRFTKLTRMSAIACANQSEPNQHWGSNFPNSPSSSVFKCRVYYVEGLGHNLFSVGQFCDSDLEVAFRKHSCYVRDTDGVELLKGSRGSNLYTISVEDMMKSSPICLLSKASKNKSWLWHRRLNHLNFGTINDLARKDLARGLPRLKFEKDHLCSACQLGKSKKHTHKPKTENTNLEVLNTLHMDLCGPMRVQTINGKKYILVIVDDYSRFTWVKFLRSKDETPAVVIKFLTQIQVGLNKTVRFIRTDNGTEFVNKTLYDHYEKVGIFHQKTVPRTPQQNGVVERRNRTLVEAARTMLIFSKAPMFLWAEAVATACYTQNRSLIHTRHEKTPYELVHDKKPDLTFF
ncbi:integrase, catalytic region, zinc finger, CCHC-type containing protein [Tanacetum coccineum]